MTEKKQKASEQGKVELTEAELDQASGGEIIFKIGAPVLQPGIKIIGDGSVKPVFKF